MSKIEKLLVKKHLRVADKKVVGYSLFVVALLLALHGTTSLAHQADLSDSEKITKIKPTLSGKSVKNFEVHRVDTRPHVNDHICKKAKISVTIDNSTNSITEIKFGKGAGSPKCKEIIFKKIIPMGSSKEPVGNLEFHDFLAFEECKTASNGFKHAMNGTYAIQTKNSQRKIIALEWDYQDIGEGKCEVPVEDHGRGGGGGW